MLDIVSFLEGAKVMSELQESKEIADKMEQVNSNLRYIFSDYEEQVKPVKEFIRKVMTAKDKDILPATIMVMEAALEKDNATHAMWFMSAAVDLINEEKEKENENETKTSKKTKKGKE